MKNRRTPGFTLIEVLVALAILAVALAAAVRASSTAADGALELKERLLATWIAQDRLAEYAALHAGPRSAHGRGTPNRLAFRSPGARP